MKSTYTVSSIGKFAGQALVWLRCFAVLAIAVVCGGVNAQVITEFSTGITAGSKPHLIAAGPDGNVWFTPHNGDYIGRITPTGIVTEFRSGLSAGAGPIGITAGPDGNVWFTEANTNRIGRITPTGVVTEFSAGITPGAGLNGIVAGPDGNLWFTELGGHRIGKITPTGVVTEYSAGITADAYPTFIVVGPDGNLWFTEQGQNKIGKITTAGVITEYSTGISAHTIVITAGPDGNLWFTEPSVNKIGRITPAGVVTEFSTGISAGASPLGIAAGPDGNLWFTENSGNRIGKITPSGVVTEYSTGITAGAGVGYITAGPDGNMWFTEYAVARIGRITVRGSATSTDGLKGYWDFDDCTATDRSGNGFNGTISGTPTCTTDTPSGKKLNFTGSQYIDFGTAAGQISTNQITVSANINLAADVSEQVRILNKQYANQSPSWGLEIFGNSYCGGSCGQTTNALVFHIVDSGGTNNCIADTTNIAKNTDYQVAVTFSSGLVSMYVNGLPVKTCTISRSISSQNNAPLVIGKSGPPDGFFFNGTIDQVRLYNRSLSAIEVQQLSGSGTNADGTITDPTTGLTWMRCAVGQAASATTCSGTASTLTFSQANALTGTTNFAGQSDWRLPTIRELQSIVDFTAGSPQINGTAFPQTPNGYFWSSSLDAGAALQAWHIRFNTGETVNDAYRTDKYNVRLVRGGQSSDALMSLARPTSSYVDHGNGTASHTPTGLMWQRCAKGQTWTGSTCSGSATVHTGNAATAMTDSFAGFTDWRLPTIKELATLADYSVSAPAANNTIFPAVPNAYFWSSSRDTSGHYSFLSAWLVHLGYGSVTPGDMNYLGYLVRFVRGTSGSTSSIAVTPTAARLDIPQNFTITGTGLTSGMGFTIEDCDGILEVGTGTDKQRTYQCTPRLPGPKLLTFKKAPGGDTLFTTTINIDHPARLGNAGARGIPSVNGVSLWNGNVHLEATDLAVPGRGVSFALTRSYNSYSWAYEDSRGSVGNSAPWRFNWDLKLGYVAGTGNKQIWVEREDGSGENFFKDATDGLWYPMDQGNFNRIQVNPSTGQTTLLTREGLQYVFFNADYSVDPGKKGLLIGIYDHDGNGLTVHRDASNRVGTVSDASNRVYTFSYDTANRLINVTDFTTNPIRQVAYTWDGTSNRLATVTDVRRGVTTYNYTLKTSALALNKPADQTLLTSIIDPVGYLAATRYNARTFTYTDKVYGNWGVDSAKDALNNTWSFVYCAKLASSSNCSNGSTQVDPVTALSFETTTTPPQGAVTVARFDTGGRLVEQVNAKAKTSKTTPLPLAGLTSKTYNLAALAQKRQSALGATGSFGTDYAYTPDNAGNLRTKATSISATETATTGSTWSPANAATLLTKNLHRASTVTDAKGAPTALTHTNSGSLTTHQPPGLAATVLGYDPAAFGQLTSVTDARSNTTTRKYDTDGNLVKLIDPPGTAAALYVQYTPDALGRVVISRDKRGFITNNTWDEAGNLKSTESTVNGQLIRVAYDYDANGNRSKMTDANRNVTNYTYDSNNRLKTVEKVRPGLSTLITTTNYDPLGRVTSTVNANSHANTTVLDDVGNTTSSYSALGLSYATLYQYDDDNRVTQVTDPDGRVTQNTYDRVGHVKTVITGFGSATPLTTRYDYDLNGRMVKMTDPRNNITQYDYDPAGRLTTLTDANLKITRATYDGNGNLLTVQDPFYTLALDPQHKTVYTYDELNRPLTRVDGNGQVWTNTYNDLANTKTLTVPGPKTTTFSFDAVDRLIRVDYPDATWVTYTYYADGSRKTMVDSTGTTQYFYDAVNRLTSKIDPAGKTVGYDYDGIGNVTTLTYPGLKPVGYHYDPGERLDQVTDWLGKTTVYTLNKAGQVTHALFGNLTTVDRVFDASGRQTSLINKKADGTVISSHGLTLDGNGNITASTTTLPLQPSLPNVNRAFTYDGANRLATASGAAVTHDLAGRITGLAGNTYAYNDRDQITGVTVTGTGTQTASHAYNGQGHRVTSTIGGTTTRFVIDPNRSLPEVLAETDAAGTVLRNYVYGYGLVEQIDAAGSAKYYHFDPTGSTLALTNATGVVTDSYAYTPYGETTTSGSTVNPFKYVGKLGVMDDGNGLHYMRARYYRADIGRFMSLDQLAGSAKNPQTLNRYAYATGNPVMGSDPSGLVTEGYSMYSGYVMGPSGPYMPKTDGGKPSLIGKFLGAENLWEYFKISTLDSGDKLRNDCAQAANEAKKNQLRSVGGFIVGTLVMGTGCILRGAGDIASGALDTIDFKSTATKSSAHVAIDSIGADIGASQLDMEEAKELVDLAVDLGSLFKVGDVSKTSNYIARKGLKQPWKSPVVRRLLTEASLEFVFTVFDLLDTIVETSNK